MRLAYPRLFPFRFPIQRFRMSAIASSSPSGVILYTHAACEGHAIQGHPEQPRRIPSIVGALERAFPPSSGLRVVRDAPGATDDQLKLFHTSQHVAKVFAACAKAEGKKRTVNLDGDTSVMKGSAEAARRACGAACSAVEAVCEGRASSAFCAVRPPGHHAEPNEPMGFCLFGNAGIAALHAKAKYGLERVAVVDWDVHHGNGTQAFFEKDPTLFFGSSHQMPCYPGTGHPSETGCSHNVVNVGLPPGSGSQTFRNAWAETILPALEAFQPQLIVVSAGFDAHESDPLADVKLQDADFYWVQGQIMDVAKRVCDGKVVSVLEGGYDLSAIARSAVKCVRAQVEASPTAIGPREGATVEAAAAAAVVAAPAAAGEAAVSTVDSELSSAISGLVLDRDKKEGSQESRPVSEEGVDGRSLHRAVLQGFERCRDEKLIRSDPTHGMERCVLEGNLGLALQFDAAHFTAKRPSGVPPRAVSMDTPFNPAAFNFAKADPRETIGSVATSSAFAACVEAAAIADAAAATSAGRSDAARWATAAAAAAAGSSSVPSSGCDGGNEGAPPSVSSSSDEDSRLVTTSTKISHPVLVNASPLMKGHSVVPLWCHGGGVISGDSSRSKDKQQFAQALAGANAAPAAWAAACEVAVQLGLPDPTPEVSTGSGAKNTQAAPELSARLGFNSHGAFASVNHLHLHIMYAEHLGGDSGIRNGGGGGDSLSNEQQQQEQRKQIGFPVEHAAVARRLRHARGVAVDLLAWPVPCFSFSAAVDASSSDGSGGNGNGADSAVAAAAGALVEQLATEQIPYNVLFVPGTHQQEGNDGRTRSIGLRVIVFPRQPQECFDPHVEGFNAAVCEVSGLLVAFSSDAYEKLNESSVTSSLGARVGLPDTELDRICLIYQE